MSPENSEVISGNFLKLRPKDSRVKLGITPKHFSTEAKMHNWEKEAIGSSVYYYVPREYYEMRQRIIKERNITSDNQVILPLDTTVHILNDINTSGANTSSNQGSTEQSSAKTDFDLQQEVQELRELVKKQADELLTYRNELETRNNALVKYKDQDKQLQRLEETVNKLVSALEAKNKKPFWKFW